LVFPKKNVSISPREKYSEEKETRKCIHFHSEIPGNIRKYLEIPGNTTKYQEIQDQKHEILGNTLLKT
jgi:hypothetical protein